ncbi:NUDIX hydrolase [Xanthobacter sp. NM-25]|uniref:NUDIX hydrolase n=1 Tax=unclassified Xanthobacter TaxID=2623496 RepID=UPI003FD50183
MAVAGNGHPGRRVQYAALPYRVRRDGEVQLRLITSRETRRWVIPKGWPMKGLSPSKAAAREAYEEAGLVGIVGREALGMYTYEKNLGLRSVLCDVMVFPLKVKRHLHKWPERSQRVGFWFSIDSAAAAVQEEELKLLILAFGAHMAARWAAKHASKPEALGEPDKTSRVAQVSAVPAADVLKGPAVAPAKDKAKKSAKKKLAKDKGPLAPVSEAAPAQEAPKEAPKAAKKAAKKAAAPAQDEGAPPPGEKAKGAAKGKARVKAKAAAVAELSPGAANAQAAANVPGAKVGTARSAASGAEPGAGRKLSSIPVRAPAKAKPRAGAKVKVTGKGSGKGPGKGTSKATGSGVGGKTPGAKVARNKVAANKVTGSKPARGVAAGGAAAAGTAIGGRGALASASGIKTSTVKPGVTKSAVKVVAKVASKASAKSGAKAGVKLAPPATPAVTVKAGGTKAAPARGDVSAARAETGAATDKKAAKAKVCVKAGMTAASVPAPPAVGDEPARASTGAKSKTPVKRGGKRGRKAPHAPATTPKRGA